MKRSKRLFDLFWTVPGLLALGPLFLLIGLAIVLEDGRPVFYRQERVGFRGKPFRLVKFRTMAVGADRGGLLTVGQRDPRVTRVGYWLRRTKLDELPQLLNVLRGEMSLVGPRPEVARYVALYTPAQRRVLDLVPGITDPASIRYRDESDRLALEPDPERAYVERIMADKIRINLEYAARATVASDFRVVLATLLAIRGEPAPRLPS